MEMIDTTGRKPGGRKPKAKTKEKKERIKVNMADQQYLVAGNCYNPRAKRTFEDDVNEQRSIIGNEADSQLEIKDEYAKPQEELESK